MASQMAAMMSIGSSNTSAPVKHALCFLLSKEHLDRYLAIHHIVEDRLITLAAKLQAVLDNPITRPDALEVFNAHVLTVVHNVECVFEAGITRIALNRTLWWHPWGSPVKEPGDAHHAPYDPRFLAICVTSHLCTMGCTTVIGSDIAQVNQMVDSLLCFSLSAGDHRRAAYATSTSEDFIPGLSVQGMVAPSARQSQARTDIYASAPMPPSPLDLRASLTGEIRSDVGGGRAAARAGAFKVHEEHVIQSLLPVTVIDIDRRRVTQTHPYHEFKLLREAYLEHELSELVNQPSTDNRWIATKAEGLFVLLRTPAPLVVSCLQQSRALPSVLRGGYITSCVQAWKRRAVCLMKYVEAEVELHVQRTRAPIDPAATPGQHGATIAPDEANPELEAQDAVTLDAETVSRIRNDLQLQSNEDWALVLAAAEQITPGIYVACAGDPAAIEEKFLELFESF
jgi:C9orf72-like protein family